MRWMLMMIAVLAAGPAWALDVTELTKEDVHGALYFAGALEYPEVAGLSNRAAQIRRVARDMGWKSSRLKAAVQRYESVEGDVKKLGEAKIREGFQGTRLAGRVVDVELDLSEPEHVVAYVRFRGTNSKEVIKDGSTVAYVVNRQAPFVSTLSLAAIHPRAPENAEPVWASKIGHSSMARVQQNRIETFADRLYGRMFEVVKQTPF
jgi:hypothetical protein